MLTLVSILVAFTVYLWQRRSEKQGEIEKGIEILINSIDYFNNIVDEAIPYAGPTPSSESLTTIENRVINNYNDWTVRSKDYMNFSNELNRLQLQIHTILLENLNEYYKKNKYDENYKIDINMDNFERWMKKISPFLNEFEGVYTGIYSIILKNKDAWRANTRIRAIDKDNLSGFYEKYWDALMKIREDAITVDKKMRNYNQFWFNSLFESHVSVVSIEAFLIIITIFGLLVPLYMIQPNKIGILTCDQVFYGTVGFFMLGFGFLVLAWLKMHKYNTESSE